MKQDGFEKRNDHRDCSLLIRRKLAMLEARRVDPIVPIA
jgi:hypothetical protein